MFCFFCFFFFCFFFFLFYLFFIIINIYFVAPIVLHQFYFCHYFDFLLQILIFIFFGRYIRINHCQTIPYISFVYAGFFYQNLETLMLPLEVYGEVCVLRECVYLNGWNFACFLQVGHGVHAYKHTRISMHVCRVFICYLLLKSMARYVCEC